MILYASFVYWLGLMSGLVFRGFTATSLLEPNHQHPPQIQSFLPSCEKNHKPHTQPTAKSSHDNFVPLKPSELKVPAPVIVMGLMKAGTTSIYGYFKCGLDPKASKISHYNCNNERGGTMSCGKRIRRNITKMKVKAFDSIDMFHVYTELDGQEYHGGITVPQWQFLDEIYTHFPNATWIMNLRDPRDWLRSIDRWQDLRQRFIDNSFQPILPKGKGGDDNDMIQFYQTQAQKVRDFAEKHPSLTLIEVKIDSPDAGTIMEDAFGIPADVCWKKRNANNDGNAIWAEK